MEPPSSHQLPTIDQTLPNLHKSHHQNTSPHPTPQTTITNPQTNQITFTKPLGIPITNIFAFKSLKKRTRGAIKCTLNFKCHWNTHQSNYAKCIPQSHILNPSSILYEHKPITHLHTCSSNQTTRHQNKTT